MDSSTSFVLEEIDNGADPQDPSKAGLEANLDVQVHPTHLSSRSLF
jgi:hypothetical protein